MQEKRFLGINDLYLTFSKGLEGRFGLNLEDKTIEEIAEKAKNDLVKNKKPVKNPTIIRLAGQSGSGKTTQLLKTIQATINTDEYVHMAVRLFATMHPEYDELLKKFGAETIREETNGFAILVVFKVLEKLIAEKYNILFEITILEPDFERYFAELAKKNNFRIVHNILAVPKEISDGFIKKRETSIGEENKRVVYTKTSNYFFDVLAKTLKAMIDFEGIYDENDLFIIWSIFQKKELYVNSHMTKEGFKIFERERKKIHKKILLEKSLFEYKKNFLKKYL